MSNQIGIGLALGGGGVRGYAHIGVLRALEEGNIPINFIAGVSAGALVGALYAKYKSADTVQKIIFSSNWRNFFATGDISLAGGLVKGQRLEGYLREVLEDTSFAELKVPFKAIATDYETGERVEIMEGKVAPAIHASAAFPFVFEPVLWQERRLYDGGMSDPVPCDTCRGLSDINIVIGVNLDNQSTLLKTMGQGQNMVTSGVRAIETLKYRLSKDCLKLADVTIEPQVGEYGIFDLKSLVQKNMVQIINEGEAAGKAAGPQIKKLIEEISKK